MLLLLATCAQAQVLINKGVELPAHYVNDPPLLTVTAMYRPGTQVSNE